MAFSDDSLTLMANAVEATITHAQLHSGARGAAGTTNAIGTRVAVDGAVDADGDITWSNIQFTGLPANQPVAELSFHTASAGGTYRCGGVLTGDSTANEAGEITVTNWTESQTST